MMKNRSRDPRSVVPSTPTLSMRSIGRAPMAKPEPDYEVVEFPTEQYVNAKLQPPPPPPPRPPTGHPLEAGSSCGLCGGGNARVRCTECGRRALCASCDDMYHRHPKRRNHQRQALSQSQLRDERPPLPPKTAPPVPPPRRHKVSSDRSNPSPLPPAVAPDHRRATLSLSMGANKHMSAITNTNHFATQRQFHNPTQKVPTMGTHMGSMPYIPGNMHHTNTPIIAQEQNHTLAHFATSGRPRGSLPGFNMPPNMIQTPQMTSWEPQENMTNNWGRPLRRGTSVMELGGVVPATSGCSGCSNCATNPWRYGSCANLEHSWGQVPWPQTCCGPHPPPHNPHLHHHPQPIQTPQPYRRAESRPMSRAASRTGSRAASPACSIRSRVSRRSKHRSPSPVVLPSSDADSESENESESEHQNGEKEDQNSLGPAPPPASATWQCEHCTFVNEPGVTVCSVCCRTPTVKPKIIDTDIVNNGLAKLKIEKTRQSPMKNLVVESSIKKESKGNKSRYSTEKSSTACGPSPPRDDKAIVNSTTRLATPTRDNSNERPKPIRIRQDIAVGPSPPKEINKQQITTRSAQNSNHSIRNSPVDTRNLQRHEKQTTESKTSHSVSVGPSPPREVSPAVSTYQKKFDGNFKSSDSRPVSRSSRTSTGTSPPPQNISTQTYEVPTNWEREPSITRSRPRRRFREDTQRERSHSRLSLSSDTRESERSIRTSGGRWEWREPRDSSPGGDWSESERRHDKKRLTRRASHLDLRRGKPSRRSSVYGSEVTSPELISNNRAISLEALAGAGMQREAERGLELARLMSDAEKLGFSAAEVHAALAQNPVAPLGWLQERWPSLCAGVQAAAARLAPGVNVTELEARASLAKHRGAMWPAVNDCVERHRRQTNTTNFGEERRLRGHVWGPPTGVDDDAVPPPSLSGRLHRNRADDSSDEFEATVNKFQDDDWMYLPLQTNTENSYVLDQSKTKEHTNATNDIAEKLKSLLKQAGLPFIDEKLLLNGLLAENSTKIIDTAKVQEQDNISDQSASIPIESNVNASSLQKSNLSDFIQSENDFIDAYNALTRLSPLPNLQNDKKSSNIQEEKGFNNLKQKDVVPNEEIVDSKPGTKNVSSNSDNHSLNKNKNSRQDYSQIENENQVLIDNDGKSNNLNDIVDNTQKLIQQMKNEINLDINSIENNSENQSESSNSSDELTNDELTSDKESSYSGSEDDSDDLLTDEKQSFNSNKGNSSENSHHSISLNRTSSEENEHFEEAMDHVENEIDNFKQINIEMLNSIARTLQEEQTVSVAVRDPKVYNKEDQDVNNNLFSAVNTFEEIYAQLNNNIQVSGKQNRTNTVDSVYPTPLVEKQKPNTQIKSEISDLSSTVSREMPKYITYIEKEIEFSNFVPQMPVKLEITENKYEPQNALLEDLPVLLEDKPDNHEEIFEQNNIPLNENMPTEPQKYSESLDDEMTKNVNPQANVIEVTSSIDHKEITSEINDSTKDESVKLKNETPTMSLSRNSVEDIVPQPEIQTISNKVDNDISEFINKEVTASSDNEKTKKPQLNNKSNIPKLIKTIQTSKQKKDRNFPKVIASKVPVRRGSLKHYPAPNPPKTHFGNVLSGHVRQLQSRLFSNKTKTNAAKPVEEPSTSTASNKKKPAPPPPPKNPSPDTTNSGTKKNTFFRETCRTEDEWTDSDAEEPTKIMNSADVEVDVTPTPVTQVQPFTLRQVSGQLIDLTQVRLPEGSPERQARMLLAEGATETWEQAQLAVKLVLQGTETSSALLAALECTDLPSALAYLNQDCELCASKYPEHEMVSMLRCTHRCCRECARYYFMTQITERSIADCVCPFCKEPELENLPEDAWLDYFANMDILLKTLLETETHELFQRKLRDRTLARDPNFRWCIECSSGFFVHPKQKRLRCPECKSITCASCRKPWNSNHEGITCEQYAAWLEDNDPERSVAAVQQHLRENGLECPRCHFKYSLSRGGCMHFTCTQCKYEFCYGCGKPFTMGARCGLSEYCAKLGLHAHHPRNCLFYLRDKEPHELQTLLQMNNVTYETEASENNTGRCPIQLQRETPGGLVDTVCGSEVKAKNAGLCKNHYLEYLSRLVRGHNVDPLPILEVDDLETLVRRAALRPPPRPYGSLDGLYKRGLIEIVREKIPLD
ncbi:E3 ubiquitin-protein ligase lubel isoform X1 [Danaus plexippus]|uniref:E3 ubiquitin-protein ligase lubel isoform X1 n=1 Tax=Danaus plexippus TaxID=13037 RepID=UPI002AB2ADB1|nr:E3 ubiquitin-protein ligase lubel isoform X1 [Danaus plexippus]